MEYLFASLFIGFLFWCTSFLSIKSILRKYMRSMPESDGFVYDHDTVHQMPIQLPKFLILAGKDIKEQPFDKEIGLALRSNKRSFRAKVTSILIGATVFMGALQYCGIGSKRYFSYAVLSAIVWVMVLKTKEWVSGDYRLSGHQGRFSMILSVLTYASPIFFYLSVPLSFKEIHIGLLLSGFLLLTHPVLFYGIEYLLNTPAKKKSDLMILRVFGQKERSILFTDWVMTRWNKWGSVFTIGSYDAFESQHFLKEVSIQAGISLISITIGTGIGLGLYSISGFVLLGILFGIGGIAFSLLYFKKRLEAYYRKMFVSTMEELEASVARGNTKKYLFSKNFSFPIYCTGSFWRHAVDRLIKQAKVVMIDLRGFTQKNNGTSFELFLIADRYDFRKVLFLIDDTTELLAVEESLQKAWSQIDPSSPNASNSISHILFYEIKDSYRKEIKPLLTCLYAIANQLPIVLDKALENSLVESLDLLGETPEETERVLKKKRRIALWSSVSLIPLCSYLIMFQNDSLSVYGKVYIWAGLGVGVLILSSRIIETIKRLKQEEGSKQFKN